jgi:hypothetical protein
VPGYHGEKQDPNFLYQEAEKIGKVLPKEIPNSFQYDLFRLSCPH